MTENNQHHFIIERDETVLQSWMRDASALALFLVLIGVGVWLESPAMQWAGAFVAFIAVTGCALVRNHKCTVEEAQAKLDEIRAEMEHDS